jgi:hypothetical protein
MDELRLTADLLRANVVVVTESWLHAEICDDLLRMNHREIFRCDRRSRRGGGVCIWVDSRFLPHSLPSSSPMPSSIEGKFVRISCVAFSIILCGAYIPPGLNKSDHDLIIDYLVSELDRLLTIFPDDKVVIAGDFNDFCTRFLFENFGLVDRVSEATRNSAILDHIFIDEDLCDFYPNMAEIGPPLRNSDHNCVLLSPHHMPPCSETHRPVYVWDFRDSHVGEFLRRLSSTNFDEVVNKNCVNDMCSVFYDLLTWSLSAISSECVYFSAKDKQWMTPVLKSLINKRWAAFREKNWSVFRYYKKKVKLEIAKAKRLWCEKESKTSRGLWNVVRSFRGSNGINPWRRLLDEAGGIQELLSALTCEFHKNFSFDEDVELLPLSEQEWTFVVTPEVVFHHLSRLNCRKAIGPDMIPPMLIKLGAQFLCHPLAAIFNMSIKLKTFPTSFKHAHICPVPKSSSPRICDFRPISILSPLSKIFERIVLDHVKLNL